MIDGSEPHVAHWSGGERLPVEKNLAHDVQYELDRERTVDGIVAKSGSPDNRVDGIIVEHTHEETHTRLIVMEDD